MQQLTLANLFLVINAHMASSYNHLGAVLYSPIVGLFIARCGRKQSLETPYLLSAVKWALRMF